MCVTNMDDYACVRMSPAREVERRRFELAAWDVESRRTGGGVSCGSGPAFVSDMEQCTFLYE